MRSRNWILALFTVMVGALMASAPALADCSNQVYDTALPVSSTSPVAGGTLAQGISGVPFTVMSTLHGVDLSVRVSTQDALGNTGVLSDLYQIDYFALPESSTNFGYYSSYQIIPTFLDPPGTYYWQALGVYLDTTVYPSVCRLVASPV